MTHTPPLSQEVCAKCPHMGEQHTSFVVPYTEADTRLGEITHYPLCFFCECDGFVPSDHQTSPRQPPETMVALASILERDDEVRCAYCRRLTCEGECDLDPR